MVGSITGVIGVVVGGRDDVCIVVTKVLFPLTRRLPAASFDLTR